MSKWIVHAYITDNTNTRDCIYVYIIYYNKKKSLMGGGLQMRVEFIMQALIAY